MLGNDAIAICATFTAAPLAESLQYWLKELHITAELEFAPYNQVLQTLLDTQGVFARNANGLGVVLVRFEDWDRFRVGDCDRSAHAKSQAGGLIAALGTAAAIASSPILVCICPASPQAMSDSAHKTLLTDLEQALAIGVSRLPSVRLLSSARLRELYSLTNYYDVAADQLGHIPYTPETYAALGTAIARVFRAVTQAPRKVVVVDCDNTLWRGVCGERDTQGVQLDRAVCAVQNFLKARQKEGMLLCVCSKNAPEDVNETFDRHPEMPLGKTDFVAWRVNWRPKSENLRSLAAELSLGLDSFIFLDDNPMETAEVEAGCPGVVALTLPVKPELVPRFLEHVWAFDQNGATAEDLKRTAMYQESALRRGVLSKALSYADFLRDLELEIELRVVKDDIEIDRAAQMTQRTNQFNLRTQRFTEPAIRQLLWEGSTEILTAFVRDRFGDYGQVGLVMFQAAEDVLRVRDFLVSCRVLGKGVEHAMLAWLGKIAAERSLATVELVYQSTPKNIPARDFLAGFDPRYRSDCEGGFINRLPASVAAAVRFSVAADGLPGTAPEMRSCVRLRFLRRLLPQLTLMGNCTSVLRRFTSILRASNCARRVRPASTPIFRPHDETERQLTRIWERVLRISPIGIHDDFFELGGDSFLAVRILADPDFKSMVAREVPLTAFIEAPTIAQQADLLRSARTTEARCLVPIKPSGRRPPFYCVHGIGGSVLEYKDLSRHVHPDQPFYGIQAIGLGGNNPRLKFTIDEMALQYTREIREFQPKGPYYLGGSSFGGWVAYEMARQLTASGQQVGLVAMFDTSVPGSGNTQGVASAWRKRIDNLSYAFDLHRENLSVLGLGERLDYLRAKARGLAQRARYRLPLTIRLVNEAGEWATSNYVPGEYSGNITLFRATKQPPWIFPEHTLGWGSLVKGGIEIYDTPGHHADLVRDPRARVLAAQLEDALAKARAWFGHLVI